jgi:hypothetical protein
MNRAASPSSTTAPSNNAPPTELLDAIPAYHMDGGIPVITPTFEEFKDFRRFITTIDPLGAESGLVKVIPPREWLDSLPPITKQMTDLIRLDTAIKQRFTGTGGVFTQMNMSCRKRLSLADWKALCESDKHRPPQLDLSGQSTRVDVRNSKRQRRSESHDESASFSSSTHAPGEAYDEQEPAIAVDEAHQLTSNLIPDRGQFPDSPEYLKELERNYWKNLTFMEPWYGADIAGSLLDQQGVQHWNIAKLDSLLCRLKRPLPGVNTPYLYFGMWKATFAWHLEVFYFLPANDYFDI